MQSVASAGGRMRSGSSDICSFSLFLSLACRSILDFNDKITREYLRNGEVIVNFHRFFKNETKTLMNALDRSLVQ